MKKNKFEFYDLVCIITIIFTLAFHDKDLLFISCQLFFLIFTFFRFVKNNFTISIKKDYIKFFVRYFVFTSLSFFSILWSINSSTWSSIMISIFQVALLGFSMIIYISDEEKLEKIIFSIIIASLVLCLRLFINVPISAWGSERVGNYINYGNVGVTYVLGYSSLITFFYGKRKNNKFFLTLSFLMILVSCLTGTKKGLIAFLVGVFVILVLNSKNIIKTIKNVLLFAIISFLVFFAIIKIPVLYNAIGVRFETAIGQINGTDLDKSTRDRALLYKYSIDTFKKYPLLGVGIDGFRHYNENYLGKYAHNNYTEILADLGIVGFVSYYFVLFQVFIILIKKFIHFKTNNSFLLLGISLLITLLVGDFSSVSYFQETLQIYLCIVFGISCFDFSQKKEGKNVK